MKLTREEVTNGLIGELNAFEKLLRTLEPSDWLAPTRCEGWLVRDIAAHVVGVHSDIAAGRLEGLATPETAQRHLDERRGHTAEQIADELAAAVPSIAAVAASFDDAAWDGPTPGDTPGTLGENVELLWHEAYVHGDDIRHAASLEPGQGPGLRASLVYVARALAARKWGPATLAFDGVGRFPVGDSGREITGDAHRFLLAATGREDPEAIGLDQSVNIYG